MADIVNLRRVRKQRDRVLNEASAAQNRAVHGQSIIEKKKQTARALAEQRKLDGHRVVKRDEHDL